MAKRLMTNPSAVDQAAAKARRPRRTTIMAVAGALALGGLFAVAAPASPAAADATCNTGDASVVGRLLPGQILCNGYSVYSYGIADNGLPYNTAVMQTDGNFVSYDQWGNPRHVLIAGWHAGYILFMQTDGNLCEYNASGGYVGCSNTGGNPGAWLSVQDDGNCVIYLGDTGIVLWVNGVRKY